jgi:hypothetical protein
MEFKGTKGKWVVSKAYKTITDEKGFGITQENGIINSNEWDYNAQLIAHAPEMLEMLELIVEEMKNEGYPELLEKAKQLITKATTIK